VVFARTGNPNAKGNPKWEPYTLHRRSLMIWNNECKASDDPFKEERTARVALHANGAAA
jgi:para-nitrobenzyl esterase